MPNLKREEALARRELLDVSSYEVDLDLTRGEEIFGSTVTIRFSCRTPGESSFVEVVPRELKSVELNGRQLSVEDLSQGRFRLPDLNADNVLTIEADMSYSHDGEGLHRFTDPEDELTYTYMMGFLDMASRVFGCFEQPDLKAPYRLSVTAPTDWTVVANEAGSQVGPGRWEFTETKPLATYFVTVVAGPYYSVHREHDGVRFGLHARQSFKASLDSDAAEIFDVTFGCWDRLHELYGVRYPFGGTYDQCFVPEFNAGAMENPGCVTFRDEAFLHRSAVPESARESRAVTIAHEMAHMWFGDLVTMKWWDDLWLNESFANCMGYRVAAEATPFSAAKANTVVQGMRGYQADELPSTHPVSGNVDSSGEALNNFDGISYAKGGAILDQLAAALGDEVFFAGLRDYFAAFSYGNADLADFVNCLSRVAGRDLTGWADSWLRTTGANVLRPSLESRDGVITRARIEQSPAGQPPLPRPHHVHIGLYETKEGVTGRANQVAVNIDAESTEVPELVGMPVPDLVLLNDDNLSYAKVRFDDDSYAALPRVLSTISDDAARSLVWITLIDMVRSAQLPVLDYLDILGRALPGESRTLTLERQLDFARLTVACFLPEADQPAARRALTGIARTVGELASSEGDRLAAARAEIAGASDSGWLRRFLAGEPVVDGLHVDTDLRWRATLRLVVLGGAGEAEIDAELNLDPSSEGHKYAATCRAAIPSAQAKAAAWETVMHDRELSNHMLKATAVGFWWPEQRELTRQYVQRFFDEAPAALGTRAPWEVMHLARIVFPSHFVDASTVAAAEELTRGEDLNPVLRRVFVDLGAELRLAWRVRRAQLRS